MVVLFAESNKPAVPFGFCHGLLGRNLPGDGENVEAAVAGCKLFGVADATKRAINEDPKPVA